MASWAAKLGQRANLSCDRAGVRATVGHGHILAGYFYCLFLAGPQVIHVFHSYCTSAGGFSIAVGAEVTQSNFTACVDVLDAAVRLRVGLADVGSRDSCESCASWAVTRRVD